MGGRYPLTPHSGASFGPRRTLSCSSECPQEEAACMTSVQPQSLSPEQLASYERDGYLILRDVFSPSETAQWRAECDRLLKHRDLIDSANLRCRWQPHVETAACLFECFDPVIDISPVFSAVAHDRADLRAAGGDLRRSGPPVQRQADVQTARCPRIWHAPGLHRPGAISRARLSPWS